MNVILTALAIVVIIATVLPFSRSSVWWIRTFDFPRAQIAIIGALVFAADLAFRSETGPTTHILRFGLALCILYQAWEIRPYTVFARKEVQDATRPHVDSALTALLANVKMQNRNATKLLEIIRKENPDLILIVEADTRWEKALGDLAETHPFTLRQPQDNTYGMLLYSRLQLTDPEVRFLIQNDIPSMHAFVKLPHGPEVEIHCLHPRPPVPQEAAQSTERDAELIVVGKEIKQKEEKRPIVVMGDLNDVAWSRTNYLFQKISGLVDPRIGRGAYNSFHADYFFLRFPLDHFFHSTHFRLIELKRLDYFGSDHFPMSIRLSYEPEAKREQKAPEAQPSDEAQAAEKLDEAAKEPGLKFSGAKRPPP